MDPERFDAVIRTLGHPSTRRSALAGLVAAALAGLLGLGAEAKRRRGRGRGRGRGRLRAEGHKNGGDHGGGTTRVTVCHKPGTPAEKTLEIDDNALPGHLGHGDHNGPCCEPPARFCPTDPDDDPNTGTCELCCPRCGPCQNCVGDECRRAEDGTGCEVDGDQGVCCDGTCRVGAGTCPGCSPACEEPEVCQGNRCICPAEGGPCPPDFHCCPEGCRPPDVPCNCLGEGGPCPPGLQCCPFRGCREPDQPCPCPGSGAGGPCPPGLRCCPFVACLPPEEPCPCPGNGGGGPCPPELQCCPFQGCIPPGAPCQV